MRKLLKKYILDCKCFGFISNKKPLSNTNKNKIINTNKN